MRTAIAGSLLCLVAVGANLSWAQVNDPAPVTPAVEPVDVPPAVEREGLRIEVGAMPMEGDISYRIGETGHDVWSATRENLSWESELEFPLDAWFVGGRAFLEGDLSPTRDWIISCAAWMNINEPGSAMTDFDRIDSSEHRIVSGENPGRYHFDSYTESDADLEAWLLDLRVDIGTPTCWGRASGFVGYLRQQLCYEVNGLSGFVNERGSGVYSVPTRSSAYEEVSDSVNVIDYEARLQAPYVGCGLNAVMNRRIRLGFEAGYSPLARIDDEDNHILRSKKSESEATGTAWFIAGEARLLLSPVLFAGVQGRYFEIDTSGDTTQSFYADTFESPAGVSYEGDVDIESDQLTALFFVGMEL